MTPIDVHATERHFVDHLAPVWAALPPAMRGRFLVRPDLVHHARRRGIQPADQIEGWLPDRPVLVASFGDLKRVHKAGYREVALLEHGAGQSYTTTGIPNHPGGQSSYHPAVGLYLVPNEAAARRWRASYPRARVEVVGCPKLDTLPALSGPHGRVALSFHFESYAADESRSAFRHYRHVLPALARRFDVIGHGHPRAIEGEPHLRDAYARAGIELVEDFEDVCRRASVYVCDNSSTIFEFATTGRPVVLLNAPWYSRKATHGLRFWDAAHVGVQVDGPDDLAPAIIRALEEPAEAAAAREDALRLAYSHRAGGAERASAALIDWASSAVQRAA